MCAGREQTFTQNVLKVFTIPISGRKKNCAEGKPCSIWGWAGKKKLGKEKMSHPHHLQYGPFLSSIIT